MEKTEGINTKWISEVNKKTDRTIAWKIFILRVKYKIPEPGKKSHNLNNLPIDAFMGKLRQNAQQSITCNIKKMM